MVGQSFGSVAGIILIVAAGGGFKQTLVDSGIGDVIANSITESAMNPLIAGWLVAVLIRLATGSQPWRPSPPPASWCRSPPA